MLSKIYILFAFMASLPFISAQNLHDCGVDHAMDTENKNRMLRNRDAYSLSDLEAIRAQRSTIYIPTTIHICGNTAGAGFASPSNAFKMLCRLNADFADQNIQFYLNDIRFVYNDAIFADAYNATTMNLMASYKVINNLNIFTNANVSRPVAGYYSPSRDFVFIQNGSVSGNSATLTHEVGHFFTLPHTFYGWEGENAVTDYSNTPAPAFINGHPVEYVARTNCQNAGDGFCDTDADYLSFRFNCPISLLVQDPSGAVITPNASFYMSYSSDACMSIFSQDQKDAMLSDIMNRSWLNLLAPANSDTLDASAITATFPPNMDTLFSQSSTHLEFEWDTMSIPGVTNWIFLLEQTIFGVSVANVFQEFVSGTNKVNVPVSNLINNRDYRWSVHPYNDGYTCANKSNYFYFKTATLTTIEEIENNSSSLSFSIYPNPNSGGNLQVSLQSEKAMAADLQIYAIDGRLLSQVPTLSLQGGVENFSIDVSMLGTGIYFVVLHTEKGVYRQKLVLNK